MIQRYITCAMVAALIVSAGLAWWWHDRAVEMGADLARANARVAQFETAAAVHRAHIERLERDAATWAEIETDLQSMEGRDAPLSDHLRRAANRLWAR